MRNKETDNTFVLANSFNPLSVNHEIISQNITCDTCINPLNILSLKPFGPELKLGEYVYDSMVNHKILTAVWLCCKEEVCENRCDRPSVNKGLALEDNDGKNLHVYSLPLLEHIYTKEPGEYKSYHKACHQEVTKGLSAPASSSPLRWHTTAASKSFIPILHKSDIPNTSNVFCSLATNFTHSAATE